MWRQHTLWLLVLWNMMISVMALGTLYFMLMFCFSESLPDSHNSKSSSIIINGSFPVLCNVVFLKWKLFAFFFTSPTCTILTLTYTYCINSNLLITWSVMSKMFFLSLLRNLWAWTRLSGNLWPSIWFLNISNLFSFSGQEHTSLSFSLFA